MRQGSGEVYDTVDLFPPNVCFAMQPAGRSLFSPGHGMHVGVGRIDPHGRHMEGGWGGGSQRGGSEGPPKKLDKKGQTLLYKSKIKCVCKHHTSHPRQDLLYLGGARLNFLPAGSNSCPRRIATTAAL